jgi:hypothetical protein
LEDVDWVIAVGRTRYPNNYDGTTTGNWIRELVLRTPLLFQAIRTDHAFLISLLTASPWLPTDWEVHVIVTCCEHGHVWETMPLLRASVEWAKERKAKKWCFQSDTDNDIGPLMRRLKATQPEPRYTMELR